MHKNSIKFIFATLSLLMVLSCGPYQKALKSDDIKLKYDLAENFYEAR